MLDIIVTHYREPWDVGSKFFGMLDLQRGVDFSDFQVILVNDGEDNILDNEQYFSHRPYTVKHIVIPHSGVSAARNAGLRASSAEWVMFCDFDDTFSHIYALMDILNVLPAPNADLLWSDLCVESMGENGVATLNLQGLNGVFNHGKVYRRQFLLDHDILFDTSFPYCEDCLFNTTAYLVCDPNRIGKITTKTPYFYVWCDVAGSVTNTLRIKESSWFYVYECNKRLCELYKRYRPEDQYCCMVARTIMDAYHALNVHKVPDSLQKMKEDFVFWYHNHKAEWKKVPYETLKLIKAKSRKHGCPIGIREEVSVTQWLRNLKVEA